MVAVGGPDALRLQGLTVRRNRDVSKVVWSVYQEALNGAGMEIAYESR